MSPSPAQSETAGAVPTRSTFITVLAWLAIIGSGFAILVSLMQAAMYFLVFRDKLAAAQGHWPGLEQVPEPFQFFFSHPEVFLATFWSLTVLTFVAAIGLLWRKN